MNSLLEKDGYLIMTTPTQDAFFRNLYESDNYLLRHINNWIFGNNYEDRILADFRYGRHHHVGVCNKKYYQKLFYRKGFRLIKTWPSVAFQFDHMPLIFRMIINCIFIKINPFSRKFSTNLIYLYKKNKNIEIYY
jgi:hypothetical protein